MKGLASNSPPTRSAVGLVALRALSAAVDSSTCFLISTLLLRELSRNQVSKKTLGRRSARLRVFSDPVQRIFRTQRLNGSHPPCDWDALRKSADACEELDYPHRWDNGYAQLGKWTLQARDLLRSNGVIDLRDELPPSVTIVYAENIAQAKRTDYRLAGAARKPIDHFLRDEESLLILTRYNHTAKSLRAFFNRCAYQKPHTHGLRD